MFRVITIFLLIFPLVGCSDEPEYSGRIEKKQTINMSENAVSKRWYISKFSTPIEEISDLDGECLAWAGDGECAFNFKKSKLTPLETRAAKSIVPCDEIFGGFINVFNKGEKVSSQDFNCYRAKIDGTDLNIMSQKDGELVYAWEHFRINGPHNN